MGGLLSGVRVLDLSRVLAGPWATQNLADLGAEVIKIERPDSGDDSRTFGPPFLHDRVTGQQADAAYYLACNRGKQSVAIDFSTPEGQALVCELAAHCDILVENYKVGSLEKFGLDYQTMHARFPDLVYCSVTGFGQTGPYRHRPGYDYLIQAMGGLMSVTGEADGRPGGGPQRAGVALADILTGMYATVGVLAALRKRDQGGGGQHVDVALLDVQVGVLANQGISYLATGEVPTRMGNGHPSIAPYQWFPASDGHILLAVGNNAQFVRLCEAIGRPDLAVNPKFVSVPDRVANRDELAFILEQIMRTKPVDEWVSVMESINVPCGPINTIDRVFADPQVRSREMSFKMQHPRYGEIPSIANPIRFSEDPIAYRGAPPDLGADTQEVLTRILSLDEKALSALAGKSVIAVN